MILPARIRTDQSSDIHGVLHLLKFLLFFFTFPPGSFISRIVGNSVGVSFVFRRLGGWIFLLAWCFLFYCGVRWFVQKPLDPSFQSSYNEINSHVFCYCTNTFIFIFYLGWGNKGRQIVIKVFEPLPPTTPLHTRQESVPVNLQPRQSKRTYQKDCDWRFSRVIFPKKRHNPALPRLTLSFLLWRAQLVCVSMQVL